MRPDLPSGTVTFLFTDVEGSTKLLHDLGADAYAESLAEHRRVIREACAHERGVEVDTQGDAFFFAFATAPGALAAASALTEALASGPIQVRVGLHTGTPLLTDEGYVGDDVHRAARIAAAGHGGQVLVSASTAPLVELELRDLGEHRFKDLSAPERVFQLGQGDFPLLKTLYQSNLPIPQTPFLGREKELGEVLSLLERDDVRLLTLTGPGGTGKTRLAAQAAGAQGERYPNGVFWVPLAPLRDPALVLESAGQALGAKNGLAAHIADKKMLLLFDNFEQVVEAASGLSALLGECSHLELLVTSREPLHLAGEQEYSVPPFAPEEGVGFFLARARTVKPEFEVDEAVPEICRRLDELPLALELAASRAKALSSKQILSRLEQRLPLLTGGSRDAPERQRTLSATIEWSYDLLSAEEQQLFRRLSVFAGGCTLEAAEEVCDADLDTLQSLVEKSLLRFSDERYWMLETIREYAATELDASVESAELHRRHAESYWRLAEQSEPEWSGPDAPEWLARCQREIDNVRAAISWGLRYDRILALALVSDLWFFWSENRLTLEGRRLVEETWTKDAPAELRIRALRAKTAIATDQVDVETMATASAARLELAREVGDRRQEAAALGMLGVATRLRGDLATARPLYEESVALYRELGDPSGVLAAVGNLAQLEREEGHLARSRELLEEHLAISKAEGSEIDVGWAVKELGMTAIAEGAFEEGRRFLSEGFEIASRVGLPLLEEDLVFITSVFASKTERSQDAAVLAGAVQAMIERVGAEFIGTSKDWHALLDALRETLGDSEFEMLTAEGRSLDHQAAVHRARSWLASPAG